MEERHSGGDAGIPLHDMDLAHRVCAGSTEAWHQFITRYERLLSAVIRQHLAFEPEDERRSVMVSVLEYLFTGGLHHYEGRSSLATWLVVVARARALDHLRQRRGRRRTPAGYERLGEFEQRVFQLFWVEWLPLEAVLAQAPRNGRTHGGQEVLAALERIDECIDRRFLDRARYDRAATREGARTGRELAFLVEARADHDFRMAELSPEALAIQAEHGALLERLRRERSGLGAQEQQLLELRFERAMTAPQIARALRLRSVRSVYSLLDRVLRQLRERLLGGSGSEAQ